MTQRPRPKSSSHRPNNAGEQKIINMLKGIHWLDGVNSASMIVNFDSALKTITRPNPDTVQMIINSTDLNQWIFARTFINIDEMLCNAVSLRYEITCNVATGLCEISPIFGDDRESLTNRILRRGFFGKDTLIKYY